jgi:hypothetical protein
MVGFRRSRALPSAAIAFILVSASRAADTLDFSFYPKGAISCLDDAAEKSLCQSSSVELTNSCLCRNGGDFITNTAACVGRSSRDDLATVYETMRDACANSNTPINVSEDEFMAAASAVATTSTTSSPGSTGTAPAAQTQTTPGGTEQGSSGLSTGALAGIIAGAVIVSLALLGALAFFLIRRRRRQGEESHPMLPQQQMGHTSLVPMGGYYASPPDTAGLAKGDWRQSHMSSDVRESGFNWESPAHLSYSAKYPLAPSPPPQELDAGEQRLLGTAEAPAEMGGAEQGPAEMGGTPVVPPSLQPRSEWHQPPR